MHNLALDYLSTCCNKDQIVTCLAYRLLKNKCHIIPEDSDDETFWAKVNIKNKSINVMYNSNKFKPNGTSFDNPGVKELAWVLLHEATHVLFGDFENINQNIDSVLWNIAVDARNNPCIIDTQVADVVKYLWPCLDDTNTRDFWFYSGVNTVWDRQYSKEEIYELLLKKFQSKVEKQKNKTNQKKSSSQKDDNDETSSQESAEDTVRKEFQKGILNGNDLVKISVLDKIDDPILKYQIDNVTKYEVEKLVIDVAEQFCGETHQDIASILDKIGKVAPTKSIKNIWIKTISKYINGCGSRSSSRIKTWRRPNKRREDLPGYKTLRYKDVAVFIDISGSMTDSMKKAIENVSVLSQFNNGLDRVVLWDTELCKEYARINKKQLLESLAYIGGGTKLSEGLSYIDKRISRNTLLIVISDLADWEKDKFVTTINTIAQKRTVIVGYPHQVCHEVLEKIKTVNIELK